ncbi:MAG: hypothetical protein EON60_13870 [Alphaproteobacteria bacterium]|nr:MAG: hypothetical protein EON60_13870 [Alphaproteobacteria bacterium]
MALFLTMLIVVVVGVMRKPAETLSLLGVLILGGLLQTHATETVGAFLVLCLAGMLLKRIQRV